MQLGKIVNQVSRINQGFNSPLSVLFTFLIYLVHRLYIVPHCEKNNIFFVYFNMVSEQVLGTSRYLFFSSSISRPDNSHRSDHHHHQLIETLSSINPRQQSSKVSQLNLCISLSLSQSIVSVLLSLDRTLKPYPLTIGYTGLCSSSFCCHSSHCYYRYNFCTHTISSSLYGSHS